MRNRRSAAGGSSARPVRKFGLILSKYRRIILATIMLLTVLAAGAAGFILGNGQPTSAEAPILDGDCVAAFANQLAVANQQCAQVEQLNLQEQLDAEISKAAGLEQTIDDQRTEMDNLESTILNALMANLAEKSISRSRKTFSDYRQEAKNLVNLSYKLKKFLKTDAAKEIDLEPYKNEIAKRLSHLPTIKPISGRYNGYGYRTHPIHGYWHFHPAADVGAPRGTKIKAAAAGRVTVASYNWSAGNYVTINHGNGFTTTYMHCSKLLVRYGQYVEKGETIALVGNTGTSTCPHLHYELRFNGDPVNPKSMIME
jgi:murein DD-endopeptidase MepM/ murein hydrolase activator NlpD